jgi:Cu+-exporting ATPase
LGKLGFPSKSITSQKLKPGEMDLKLKSQVDESEIENLIQKIQGVKNVTIKKGIIHVDFDEMLTSKREIKEYIEENGNCETELIVPDTKGLKESILREAEARRWRNLFIFSAIFTIPTMIFAMIFGHIDYFRQYIMMRVHPSLNLSIEALVLLILVTPVQFIGGAPFYVLAFKSLRRFSADMNVLVVLATTEAYVYSLFAIIYGMVDESFEGMKNSHLLIFSSESIF